MYKNCANCTANGFVWCKTKCIEKSDTCFPPTDLRTFIDECTEGNAKSKNLQICGRMHIVTSLNQGQ